MSKPVGIDGFFRRELVCSLRSFHLQFNSFSFEFLRVRGFYVTSATVFPAAVAVKTQRGGSGRRGLCAAEPETPMAFGVFWQRSSSSTTSQTEKPPLVMERSERRQRRSGASTGKETKQRKTTTHFCFWTPTPPKIEKIYQVWIIFEGEERRA